MIRYAALLRGINLGQKNKLPMVSLRQIFAEAGCTEIITILNSGNVVFSREDGTDSLAEQIGSMIRERFGFFAPVCILEIGLLRQALEQAPAWWGTEDTGVYDNLILPIPPATADEVTRRLGPPSEELERYQLLDNMICWSFDRQRYAKANWWKRSAEPGIGELMTIRTANTIRKLVKAGTTDD